MTLFYWYLLDLNNFVEFSYLEKTRIYFIPIVYHLFLNCCKNILIQVTNCFKLIVRTLFYFYTKKNLKTKLQFLSNHIICLTTHCEHNFDSFIKIKQIIWFIFIFLLCTIVQGRNVNTGRYIRCMCYVWIGNLLCCI